MHDMIQYSKCDSTILGSSRNYKELEALQLPLMVMSGSHNSGKVLELNQIWIFSQNYFLCMVPPDVISFLKDVWYFGYSLSNFQDSISN